MSRTLSGGNFEESKGSSQNLKRLDGEFEGRCNLCGEKKTVRKFSHRPYKDKIGYVRDRVYLCKDCFQKIMNPTSFEEADSGG